MLLRSCVLVLTGLSLCACQRAPDSLETPAQRLRELAAEAAVHRGRLERDLAARDDLGPGEYQRLLRQAFADALRAALLHHESRAATLLAGAAGAIGARTDAVPRLLEAGLPAALAEVARAPESALGRLAEERAREAATESQGLRERAAGAVADLKELRARVIELRSQIARERLALAERLAGPKGTPGAAELLPLARAEGVKLTGVRRLERREGGGAYQEVMAVTAEGRPDRAAAFALALGRRPATEVAELGARGGGDVLGIRARLLVASPRGAVLADEPAPSSTVSVLAARLRHLERLRAELGDVLAARPGPAVLLSVITAALPEEASLLRFSAAGDRFELEARAPGRLARAFLDTLGRAPGVDLVSPSGSGRRLVVRGRWRAPAPGEIGASPPPPVFAARAPRSRAPAVRAELPDAPLEGFQLAGVVSAGAGQVRALLRDAQGASHIVQVGSRLEGGAQVAEIGRDYVLARAGTRTIRIRAK